MLCSNLTATAANDCDVALPHQIEGIELRQKEDVTGYGNQQKVPKMEARYVFGSGNTGAWFDFNPDDFE